MEKFDSFSSFEIKSRINKTVKFLGQQMVDRTLMGRKHPKLRILGKGFLEDF